MSTEQPKKKSAVGYGRPPEHTKWKKGQSGNPKGSKPLPEDVKVARKLTQVEFERICVNLFCMSSKRMSEVVKDPETPVLTALVARILLKGINESSRVELNYFIERFLGKVPEQSNITGNLNGTLADFIANRNKPKASEGDDDDFT